MAFVKLDTGILNSTLWIERDQRELFITALLMAEPREFSEPVKQIKIGDLDYTGFEAPPGWYGFVPAASVGIIRRAGVDKDSGMDALRLLGEPDPDSRSKKFEGRRLIRMNGGFIILNYMDYRDKDHTAAIRQQRLRDRRKALFVTRDEFNVTRNDNVTKRNITHAEAEADTDAQKQKPSRKRATTKTAIADARHAEFKEAIKVYWDSKNKGVAMPWGPAEGKQLGMLLRQAPDWTLDQFKAMLRNRYKSNVNHGDRPSQWIFYIASYGPEAVDRFNKPIEEETNGKSGPSPAKQRIDGARRVLAQIAIDRGLIDPTRFRGGTDAPIPESGSGGQHRGVLPGLRETCPEILPPESPKGSRGSAH